MNNTTNEGLIPENDKIYQLRRKNFQRKLVTQLCYLGYVIIVLNYLKYGCTIWTLMLRTCVQSLLAAPFPNEAQMRRLSLRNELPGSNYFPGLSAAIPTNSTLIQNPMPGAFPSNSTQEPEQASDNQANKVIEDEVKKKIRGVLFHGSLTVNIFYIIIAILFPVNFRGKLEGNYLHEDGLNDTPSPFNHANGLIQGERKGGFFMQMIGEPIPQSNLKGNLGIIMFEFAILFCQFGLFILTCINFANLGVDEYELEEADRQISLDEGATQTQPSDGYDGKVFVTQIDPNKAINDILYSPMEPRQDAVV